MNFRDAYIHMLLQESETDDWEFDFRRMGADPKRARKMAELINKVGEETLTDKELDKAQAYYGLLKKYYAMEAEKLKKGEEEVEQLKKGEEEVEQLEQKIDFLKSGGPIAEPEENDPADWWKKQ